MSDAGRGNGARSRGTGQTYLFCAIVFAVAAVVMWVSDTGTAVAVPFFVLAITFFIFSQNASRTSGSGESYDGPMDSSSDGSGDGSGGD